MRFDDRLLTVLNQPSGDRHDAAVRWRQMVDLVARAGPGGSSPVVAQALESIRAQAGDVEENLRAAAARAVAGRPLPLALLEYFAADRLSVSAPVLAAATLDPAQWRALLATADDETRNFVETLHPEASSVAPAAPEPMVEQAERQGPPRHGAGGGRAQILIDVAGLCADRFQRLADDWTGPGGTGARDEVDQLPPTDRGVVAVAGRLVQHCEQAIVETHLGQFPSKHRSPALGHGLLGAKRESVNYTETGRF